MLCSLAYQAPELGPIETILMVFVVFVLLLVVLFVVAYAYYKASKWSFRRSFHRISKTPIPKEEDDG